MGLGESLWEGIPADYCWFQGKHVTIEHIDGSKGGGVWRTHAPPPPGTQILSISCSFGNFWQNRMFTAPHWRVHAPPRGNPGSATVQHSDLCAVCAWFYRNPHHYSTDSLYQIFRDGFYVMTLAMPVCMCAKDVSGPVSHEPHNMLKH